jgi:hypothetical protein
MKPGGGERPVDDAAGGVIAAHGVDGDSHQEPGSNGRFEPLERSRPRGPA